MSVFSDVYALLGDLEKAFDYAKDVNADLQRRLDERAHEHALTTNELEQCRASLVERDQRIREFDEACARLTADTRVAHERCEEAEARLAQADDEMCELRRQNMEFRKVSKLVAMENENVALRESVRVLEKSLRSCRSELALVKRRDCASN